MVYGGVRVAVLLYTLWPVLAGPFCLPVFFNPPSSSRSYAIPSQHWDTGGLGWGGGRLAANTAANAGSNGGCVCLFVPTTKSLARPILWKRPPTSYLTPASTMELCADPALARICSSNTAFPSEPSCLVRTRQRRSKNESEEKGQSLQRCGFLWLKTGRSYARASRSVRPVACRVTDPPESTRGALASPHGFIRNRRTFHFY